MCIIPQKAETRFLRVCSAEWSSVVPRSPYLANTIINTSIRCTRVRQSKLQLHRSKNTGLFHCIFSFRPIYYGIRPSSSVPAHPTLVSQISFWY